MKRSCAVLLALGISWTSQAIADDTSDDVRCLVVSLNLLSSQDAATKSVGTLSTFYWLGRLDGRTPDLDMENRIMAEAAAMTPALAQAEAARCGTIMQGRGKAMTDIGKDMVEKGKAAIQQGNSH